MSPAEVDAAEAPPAGYPSYEGAAEQLLLAYPIEVLLAALDASTDNPAAAYGAARLFGGWHAVIALVVSRAEWPVMSRVFAYSVH